MITCFQELIHIIACSTQQSVSHCVPSAKQSSRYINIPYIAVRLLFAYTPLQYCGKIVMGMIGP